MKLHDWAADNRCRRRTFQRHFLAVAGDMGSTKEPKAQQHAETGQDIITRD